MTALLQVKFKVGMNLPQFINNVQDHSDMYSLNTWTYLSNPYKSTKMLSMIKSYPNFLANVDDTIQKALKLTEKFDEFDSENSNGAAGFILASLYPDLKNTLMIMIGLGKKDHFVCIWICLVNRVIQVNSTYSLRSRTACQPHLRKKILKNSSRASFPRLTSYLLEILMSMRLQ